MKISDILVVGGGPAGLNFCAALSHCPLDITLIERQDRASLMDPPFDGREIALSHIAKNIMESNGVWQHIRPQEIYLLKEAKVFNGESNFALHFPTPSRALGGQPTDTLGYFVPNDEIRRASYAAVAQQSNLNLLSSVAVEQVRHEDDLIAVKLSNGDILHTHLLVAADSRFSLIRRQLGIATDSHDFGRTVIVFRIRHSISNQRIARECFHYGRTLAILPLNEYECGCVITIDSDQAHLLEAMNAEERAADINAQLKGCLGNIEVSSSAHSYPLVGVHARSFIAPHAALIGDAAVGMHPVTAHGFNLGLYGVRSLSDLIIHAQQNGEDIASPRLLHTYERQHMRKTRPLYHGTNLIVKIFTNETGVGHALRGGILRLSNAFPPVKYIISKQLTG